MSSSDQFFLSWIQNNVGNRVKPIVIGDLDFKQAQEFFDSYGLSKSLPINNTLFQECYDIGGNF